MTTFIYIPAKRIGKKDSKARQERTEKETLNHLEVRLKKSDPIFDRAWKHRSGTDAHLKKLIRMCLLKGVHEHHAESLVHFYIGNHGLKIQPVHIECNLIPAVVQEPHTAKSRLLGAMREAGEKHKPAHVDILQHLMVRGQSSPSEIATTWNRNSDQIQAALQVMTKDGIVIRTGHGIYEIPPNEMDRVEQIKDEVKVFRAHRSEPFRVIEHVMLDDIDAGNSVHPYSEEARTLMAYGEKAFLKTEKKYTEVDWTGVTATNGSWRVDPANVDQVRQRWIDETATKFKLPTEAWNEPLFVKDAAVWRGKNGATVASETPGMSILEALQYVRRYGITKPVFGLKRGGKILPVLEAPLMAEDFFLQCCQVQPGSITSSAELIAAHADWCRQHSFRPMSGKQIAVVLVKAGCQPNRVWINGVRTRVWSRLKLSN